LLLEWTVHPHACGEYDLWIRAGLPPIGSSPRMWGILLSITTGVPYERFIPTHVGNISKRDCIPRNITVHPHACGEYTGASLIVGPGTGSSPRMWGIWSCWQYPSRCDRFIPTHVGNMVSSDGTIGLVSVHPHACGEYRAGWETRPTAIGSSPRMWGISQATRKKEKVCRFIPTHVGNISRERLYQVQRPVHPHACGEYGPWPVAGSEFHGSSPRMWGI